MVVTRGVRWLSALIALPLAVAIAAVPFDRAAAGPSLVIDAATRQVLHSEEPDASWYPASLTKLMTAYLTFEAVKSGRLAWNAPVPLSEKARAQPATRIGLRLGIQLNVEQAVRGLILRSANDFAMALAELIGGSEEGFADLMNAAARRLGMTRTHFANPHGLPDPTQISTARDMAILALALLHDFPERSEVFMTPTVLIHKGTFHSQNDLLRTFVGADGMKTGFTCGSGYNVVASATRDGRRVIAVVLGAQTRTLRSQRAAELMQLGFDHIEGHKRVEPPLALGDLPMNPMADHPPHDMSRETLTHKCGNRRGPARTARNVMAKKAAAAKE
jgi:D-alanyl-D-alanine carboxypeptidase